MKKLFSTILMVCLLMSCVSAAPFVREYNNFVAEKEIKKIVAEDNYIFALSGDRDIYVYAADSGENVKIINRNGFKVSDIAATKKGFVITFKDSGTDESHMSVIGYTAIPGWNNESFSTFNAITDPDCTLEASGNYVYIKSPTEESVYVGQWMAAGRLAKRPITLGSEFLDIKVTGNYMLNPNGDMTEVYDISSSYEPKEGTKICEIPTESANIVRAAGNYMLCAAGSTVKAFAEDGTEMEEYTYDAGEKIVDMEVSGETVWVYTGNEIHKLDTQLNPEDVTSAHHGTDIAALLTNAYEANGKNISVYAKIPYEVTNASYTTEDEIISYSADFANYTDSDISAEIYMFALKDGEVRRIVKEDLYAESNNTVPVEISDEISEEDDEIRTIIVDKTDKSKVLSAEYADRAIVSYSKTEGTKYENSAYEGEEAFEISAVDEYGNVTVGGIQTAKKGNPITISVANGGNTVYLDSIIAGEETYGFEIKTVSYGTHSVKVNDGGTIYEGSFDIAKPVLTIGNQIEDMGRDTYITMDAANMQNVKELKLDISYDESALVFDAVPQILKSAEGFEVTSINAENGILSIILEQTGKVTDAESEFLKIKVKTAETAAEGVYSLAADTEFTDKIGNTVNADVTNGTIDIRETITKYIAFDAAIAALEAVKADFGEADYRAQKEAVADANAKIQAALEATVRESDFDAELMDNLKSAEAVLEDLKEKFDAVDTINASAEADVIGVIDGFADLLGVNRGIWELYNNSKVDKSDIQEKISEFAFDLPMNFNKELCEIIVPGLIEKTAWSGVGEVIDVSAGVLNFDGKKYEDLTSPEKKNVSEALAGKSYATLAELKTAIETAIDTYKVITNQNTSGTGGISGGGSGKGKVSSNVPFVSAQTEKLPAENKPAGYKDALIFKDLDSVPWAEEAIKNLSDAGVINGTGGDNFTPNGLVTREALVKMIVLAFGITSDIEGGFTDTDKNEWYYPYISAAAAKGIVSGYSDGSFGVGKNITREEMAVIIKRAADYCGIILEEKNERPYFDDEDKMSSWAKESILIMQKTGIINGISSNEFAPAANATRAQAAKIIYELLTLKTEQGV